MLYRQNCFLSQYCQTFGSFGFKTSKLETFYELKHLLIW